MAKTIGLDYLTVYTISTSPSIIPSPPMLMLNLLMHIKFTRMGPQHLAILAICEGSKWCSAPYITIMSRRVDMFCIRCRIWTRAMGGRMNIYHLRGSSAFSPGWIDKIWQTRTKFRCTNTKFTKIIHLKANIYCCTSLWRDRPSIFSLELSLCSML